MVSHKKPITTIIFLMSLVRYLVVRSPLGRMTLAHVCHVLGLNRAQRRTRRQYPRRRALLRYRRIMRSLVVMISFCLVRLLQFHLAYRLSVTLFRMLKSGNGTSLISGRVSMIRD